MLTASISGMTFDPVLKPWLGPMYLRTHCDAPCRTLGLKTGEFLPGVGSVKVRGQTGQDGAFRTQAETSIGCIPNAEVVREVHVLNKIVVRFYASSVRIDDLRTHWF